jgi:hypothetical protein
MRVLLISDKKNNQLNHQLTHTGEKPLQCLVGYWHDRNSGPIWSTVGLFAGHFSFHILVINRKFIPDLCSNYLEHPLTHVSHNWEVLYSIRADIFFWFRCEWILEIIKHTIFRNPHRRPCSDKASRWTHSNWNLQTESIWLWFIFRKCFQFQISYRKNTQERSDFNAICVQAVSQ